MTGTIEVREPPLTGTLSVDRSLEGYLSVEPAQMQYEEVPNEAGGITVYIGRIR